MNRLAIAVAIFHLPFAVALGEPAREGTVRFATYNAALYRNAAGGLIQDLGKPSGDSQARKVAEVIQRVRPDVLLLCEFDYDAREEALTLWRRDYLGVGQNGLEAIAYEYHFSAPVNTGRPSGHDLNRDGQLGGPADAVGYGWHEGQYGMAVLSNRKIDTNRLRTFQRFLWRDMPDAKLPRDPNSREAYYTEEQLGVLRLSSKSFWDIPIVVGSGDSAWTIHFLCAHPTPPVFDGPEDRNGCRNHDEIRMIADYIDPARSGYLTDDNGHQGGLTRNAAFIVAGDLNADPCDGDSMPGAIEQLLAHPRVAPDPLPASNGGRAAALQHAQVNASHTGDPSHDTSYFGPRRPGNLRLDYLLPSRNLSTIASEVFWPEPGEPGSEAASASDHRLVWVDVARQEPAEKSE